MVKIRLALSVFLFLFTFSLSAQVKLPKFFADNMVLQQQTEAPLWGWAKKGSTVTVTPSWNGKKYIVKTNPDGQWKINIATPSAGGPYTIIISDGKPIQLKNVLVGEVWLCSGQSNMEMPMKGFKTQPVLGSNDAILHSRNKNIRLFTVGRSVKTEPQGDVSGKWEEASPETVANFSATAYYFGRLLNDILDVPVGLINTSFGGSSVETWMSPASLKSFDDITIPTKDSNVNGYRSPTVLFNGMLHPLIGFGIKGCIWYQGEGNYDKPDQYEKLFPAMVKEWRFLWNRGDYPFYFAQIAPYNYSLLPQKNYHEKMNTAYLRDAQRKAEKEIPNSGMAVLLDAGEERNIHPANKEIAGKRLAWWALAKTYGVNGFGYQSPAFESFSVKDSIATLKFAHAPNGLTSFGKELTLFEVAGSDKIFHPAKAVITRSGVDVSAPQVKNPVAIRYAFKDFVVGELFSTEGLPVSSFRTDDW